MIAVTPETVALIEDDPLHAELFRLAWQQAEIPNPLVVYRSGHEALALLGVGARLQAATLPQLLLLDLNLPGQDGVEILIEVRRDPRFADMPVVMFSTSRSNHDVERSIAAGAAAYITKPIRFADLTAEALNIADRWLRHDLPAKHGSS